MGRTRRTRRIVRGVATGAAAGAAAVALAGCWPVPGADPDRTGHNPWETTLTSATVADLTEVWRWTSPTGDPSDPVTSAAGGVHVTDGIGGPDRGCGRLVTLDRATGAVRWQAPFFADGVECAVGHTKSVGEPWVLDDVVVAGAGLQYRQPASLIDVRAHETLGLDPATGAAVTSAGNGFVAAARDGARLDSTVGLSQRVVPIQLVGIDGRRFRLAVGQFPERSLTLGPDLVLAGGGGVLATEPGPSTSGPGVRAYSRTTARPGCGPIDLPFPGLQPEPVECPVWATPTDGPASRPVLDAASGTLFSRSDAGTLYALDATTGAVRWTASGLGAGGAPALAGDTLWVPTGDGEVVPFAVAGCGTATCGPSRPWPVDTGTGAPVTAVTVAADVVYATSAGTVHATAAGPCPTGPCPVLWSGAGDGTPVVSAGHLHVRNATDLVTYALPG